jgi:hypothetical protein
MGEKITDYSSISTTNPNKLSLIDVSELGEAASIIGGARLYEHDYWQKIKYIINEM